MKPRSINKVLFIGSKQLGLDCLKTICDLSKETIIGVLTIDDSSDTRTRFSEFKDFCKSNDIPFFVARNRINSEEIIKQQNPELCIVVGWYWLIGDETLDGIPHGMLGIHTSLLPKYRGGSPLIWSIINGEEKVGISMFTFTKKLDEGDIWFQYEIDLKPEHSIKSILVEIEKGAVAQLKENYLKILEGSLKPVPQNHSEATYCAQRKPSDGLIDWSKPANEVFNFIRAQSKPYPGAFTIYKNKQLTIWDSVINEIIYYGTPGQIARITKDGVTVVCGDNKSITIGQVEYDGTEMKSNELLKTIKTRFGSSMQ